MDFPYYSWPSRTVIKMGCINIMWMVFTLGWDWNIYTEIDTLTNPQRSCEGYVFTVRSLGRPRCLPQCMHGIKSMPPPSSRIFQPLRSLACTPFFPGPETPRTDITPWSKHPPPSQQTPLGIAVFPPPPGADTLLDQTLTVSVNCQIFNLANRIFSAYPPQPKD